jgi:pyruvate/2-oxoglutarate dehydrogenase complex dihydrolipoamide dehydrogenase (E3) component
MTQQMKTDLLVIGAGSGGLSVAAGAAQMGADVILLEGGEMGGDCLNYGCVPSKALIAKAKEAKQMRDVTGVAYPIARADVNAHVRGTIAAIEPHDSQERFEGLGVRVLRAYGAFLDKKTVRAGDVDITARRIVIATGSRAFVPPIEGLTDVPFYTNETIFDLEDHPDHLIILGGGPIGVEMAQAHARLGSRVTLIEAADILGRDDPELSSYVIDALEADGVLLHQNTRAEKIEPTAQGIAVHTAQGVFEGSHLLVAVGRVPNIDGLALDRAGVDHTARGVTVNRGLRTTNRRVYAIGDAAGGMQFTHVAGYHAGVILKSALFAVPSPAKTEHIPRTTYCDPELAQIGMTEAEARASFGDGIDVVRFDFAQNDRALASDRTQGMIKMMVRKGRPIGVSIVGPDAGEMMNFWALVFANNLKLSQIAKMVSPYPTLHEVNKRVVGAYFSPKIFDNPKISRVVKFVQNWIP